MFAKKFLGTICIFAMLMADISHAQSPVEVLRQNSEAAKSAFEEARRVGNQNREEIERLRTLIETLLSQNEAENRANQYRPENRGPEAAKADATEIGERATDATENLTNPDKQTVLDKALGENLRKRMAGCATGMKARWDGLLQHEGGAQISEIEAAIQECSPDEVREILTALKAQQRRALDAWGQCRDVLISAGEFDPSAIPVNPGGLARGEDRDDLKKQLEQIKQDVVGLEESARNCGSNLNDLFDQIQNQEDSAAAMAMMMNFAASACMGSGGNPYVCGSLFAMAFLMSLFSDGGGDGDGDGESDGTGQKGDGQSVGGTGPRKNPPGDDPDGECNPAIERCSDSVIGDTDVILGGCDPKTEKCSSCRKDGDTVMICPVDGADARFDVSLLADKAGNATTEAQMSNAQKEALGILKSVIAGTSQNSITVCGASEARGLASSGIVIETDTHFLLFPTVSIGDNLALRVEEERSPVNGRNNASAICGK